MGEHLGLGIGPFIFIGGIAFFTICAIFVESWIKKRKKR